MNLKVRIPNLNNLFKDIDNFTLAGKQYPRIGISLDLANVRLHSSDIQKIISLKGIPFILPSTLNIEILTSAVDNLDGLIVTGYDEYEFCVLRIAANRQLPIFGVAEGDEFLQEFNTKTQREVTRPITLMRHFINAASVFKKAKEIHKNFITIDSHTDTPAIFPGKFNLGIKEGGKVNLPLMECGMIDSTFMVAYIPQGERDDESLKKATSFAIDRLEEVKRQEVINGDRMKIAYTPEDLYRIKSENKKAIFLGLENGYALGKDIANVKLFKDMGVSYITLCHNGDNDICDSNDSHNEWGGLSPLGKEVVSEMNRLGIMVDVSHAADSTFYDVLECSSVPVIASHSSSRAICNHPRNLTDDQLKALAAKNGVVQVCIYGSFINKNEEEASIADVITHINHIVRLIGINHVGIGSDFDGDGGVIGCNAANELINITVRLLKEGYSEEDISKIWGGNLMRVFSEVQTAAL
jgi:Zn-dependent dipeptidase, microsomal dipeptidase homolog